MCAASNPADCPSSLVTEETVNETCHFTARAFDESTACLLLIEPANASFVIINPALANRRPDRDAMFLLSTIAKHTTPTNR